MALGRHFGRGKGHSENHLNEPLYHALVQKSAWKLAEIFFGKDRMVPEENRSDC